MQVDRVEFDKEEILNVLRDLEMIVTSLDRIGSSFALDQQKRQEALQEFVEDWGVFNRLARARQILSTPFSDEVGDDGMDELEREMNGVENWSLANRKIPVAGKNLQE